MKSHPDTASSVFSQPSTKSIAARIRTLRQERGWTLAEVEKLSHGSIKAVVLGSYERCDRAISLARSIELADLFSVPLTHLLCSPEETPVLHPHPTMMLDLRRAKSLAKDPLESQDQRLITFTMFITWIANRRSDWNGEILTLRESDLSTLALMTFLSEKALLEWANKKKLLLTAPDRP